FKAFLVAVDREACALYKEALDRYLPPDWSEVVYSPAHNDSALLKKYYLDSDGEKAVRQDFRKKDKLPKLLIVTEKLLTGFDAPVLYCMYLDKPMRDHVLLQAIARVNRPYEDEDGLTKPYGFVLDFVGIFEKLEWALSFDSDTVASVIQNIDTLQQLFAAWMTERARPYLPLTRGWDDKAKEQAVAYFEDKDRRDEFFKFYRQLEALYDVLSPDPFLRPYLEQYQALSELYLFIRHAYSDSPYIDKEITAKTRELLRQYSDSRTLDLPGAIHELGVPELEALKRSIAGDTIKVLNLRKVLAATVRANAAGQPFLVSIGERAQALAEVYEDRHITTQQALIDFENLARQVVQAEAERKQLNIDENSFAIHIALKAIAGTITPGVAIAVNAVFERWPEYQWDEQQRGKLRADLYRALLPVVGTEKMIDAANTLLRLQRLPPTG
ncbi:MAG: type I restriction enzyme subunit R domain-containing protein, partial [Chloroflexota bacterium]